jgi:hypothetical protein
MICRVEPHLVVLLLLSSQSKSIINKLKKKSKSKLIIPRKLHLSRSSTCQTRRALHALLTTPCYLSGSPNHALAALARLLGHPAHRALLGRPSRRARLGCPHVLALYSPVRTLLSNSSAHVL